MGNFNSCPECQVPYRRLRRVVQASANITLDLGEAGIHYSTSGLGDLFIVLSCGKSTKHSHVNVSGTCKVDTLNRIVHSWSC